MFSFFPSISRFQLKTERLIIRPYRVNDAGQLFEFVKRNRERMVDYLPLTVQENYSGMASRQFIRKRKSEYQEAKSCFMGIFLPGNKLAGQIALREINTRVPKCEMGYVIDADAAGKGYTTEALQAVCNWCFDNLQMQKVSLRIETINTASLKVAAAAGFQHTALLRNDFRAADGRLMDVELWEKFSGFAGVLNVECRM